MTIETIKTEISEIIKDIIHFANIGKDDTIETMKQETHVPEYEKPVCQLGRKNSPRMKYRR